MTVSPARTRVLLALIAVYRRDGRATVSAVATEAGRSLETAHRQLVALRGLGLVDWTCGAAGTLRPTVDLVSNVSSAATTLGVNRSGAGDASTSRPRGQHPGGRGRQ